MKAAIDRLRRIIELFGDPDRVEPGPTSGWVTTTWTRSGGDSLRVETKVSAPVAEAVAAIRLGISRHVWRTVGQSAGGLWTYECVRCGERRFGDELGIILRQDSFGCPGEKGSADDAGTDAPKVGAGEEG